MKKNSCALWKGPNFPEQFPSFTQKERDERRGYKIPGSPSRRGL
jgi:hypothetical protein